MINLNFCHVLRKQVHAEGEHRRAEAPLRTGVLKGRQVGAHAVHESVFLVLLVALHADVQLPGLACAATAQQCGLLYQAHSSANGRRADRCAADSAGGDEAVK